MNQLITTLDYHIAVRQGLQYLDSYQEDEVQPEEIDFNLNLQQERFLDFIMTENFQDDQNKLSYVKNVIVKNHNLSAIVMKSTDADYEDDTVYAVLPSDYKYLVNARTIRYRDDANCNIVLQDSWQTDYKECVAIVDFPKDDASATYPFYPKVQIELFISGTTYSGIAYSQEFSLSDREEITPVIRNIQNFFDTQTSLLQFPPGTVRVYWEKFREIYSQNKFIFVITSDKLPTVTSFSVFARVFRNGTSVASSLKTATSIVTNYKKYSRGILNSVNNLSSKQTKCVVINLDELYDRETQNSFYASDDQQQNIAINGGKIYMYQGKKSVITEARVDYIRTPRQISLSLNQTSELAGNAPQRIVDWTIERMKVVLENPNAASLVQHNDLKTN